ncbi:5086_t:CDS:2 [Diversispora eburnea]|uniref:5086_t:CDS:1 n=1 Tax=Diversispora eburnea TaxID=1213867 RepID=A0A9N8V4Y1_9GLOM|nr:5086_t:CDS:2 [Diversispora eburnea]
MSHKLSDTIFQKPKVTVLSTMLNFDNDKFTLISQEINPESTSKDIRDNKNKVENEVNTELELDSSNNNEQNFDYTCDKEINELIPDNEELINKGKKYITCKHLFCK